MHGNNVSFCDILTIIVITPKTAMNSMSEKI